MALSHIGRYEVIDRIGQGGMGSVYLARDPALDRRIAIKLLKEEFDEEQRRRFKQEALLAGRLPHVNIITIYDVGDHEGRPFIAMSYIQGETLAQLIHRRAPLPLVRKLRIMEELCAGLQAAHNEGIVHRDIKPANVMVDQSGVVKILDFGIARLLSDGTLKTQDGTIIGSYNYMSPEQIAGRPLDHRSDIFAVGTILYELLSYTRAFKGSVGDGLLYRVVHGPPPPLREVCSHLDEDLERIVMRALEKDPAKRYRDIEAMRRDLSRVKRRFVLAEIGPLLEEVENALQEGRYERALSKSQEALAVEPDEPRALDLAESARKALDDERIRAFLDRARAELERQAFVSAAAGVESALGIDSTASDALKLRDELHGRIIEHAKQLMREGQYDRALTQLTEAEQLRPPVPHVSVLLEEVRHAQQHREQRDNARTQARKDVVHTRSLHDSGKYREALKYIEARLARIPTDWDDLRDEVATLREQIEDGLTRQVIEAEQAKENTDRAREPQDTVRVQDIAEVPDSSDDDEATVVIHRPAPSRRESAARTTIWIAAALFTLIWALVAIRC